MPYLFFVVASILGWGIGSIWYKMATSSGLHPLMMSIIALVFYAALTPLLWIFVKFDHTITAIGVAYTLIGAAFMCVGTLGFSYALRSGGAAGSTTFLCSLYPALTLVLSMIFLGEVLTIRKIIGIALALVSLIVLSSK
jgi:drug/metabolite transporter (DMT)-like permease